MMASSSRMLVLTSLLLVTFRGAESHLREVAPEAITTKSVEKSLVEELAGHVSADRLADIEKALLPTYTSLPKDADGYLSHQAVRYTLHRLFVQRHSWYIRGLEPSDEVPPPYLGGEWVPAYLQGLVEQRLGERGINLQELAALAASLEDLVHKEEAGQLKKIYDLHRLSPGSRINSKQAGDVLSTYLMIYLRGGNTSYLVPEELEEEKIWFTTHYADWHVVEEWLHDIEEHHITPSPEHSIDFTLMSRVVAEMSEKFGAFNDIECRSLKSTLVGIQGQKAGRVRLSDFYKFGLYSHWRFNEKLGYLRATGSLDESQAGVPNVIVANYLSSRTNCLESSNLYSVCCRNECEDLMGRLESQFSSPMADPLQINAMMENVPSDSSKAPREISASLQDRLKQIAAGNGGKVPLHGRLFAQWMHHVFPYECPYPHEAGTVSPQTPEEWLKESGEGETDHKLSNDEIKWHVGNATANSLALDQVNSELPWSDVEEMFGARGSAASSAWLPLVLAPLLVPVLLVLLIGGIAFVMSQRRQFAQTGTSSTGFSFDEDDLKPLKPGTKADPRQVVVVCLMLIVANLSGLLDTTAFVVSAAFGLAVWAFPHVAAKSKQLSAGSAQPAWKPASCSV